MTFKCDYCDSTTHAEVDCAQKKNDRALEKGIGCITVAFLFIPALLGGVAGAIWGALRSGFQFGEDFWPEAWKAIRGKKKNGGDGGGEAG